MHLTLKDLNANFGNKVIFSYFGFMVSTMYTINARVRQRVQHASQRGKRANQMICSRFSSAINPLQIHAWVFFSLVLFCAFPPLFRLIFEPFRQLYSCLLALWLFFPQFQCLWSWASYIRLASRKFYAPFHLEKE